MEKIIYHVRRSATKPPVLEILEGKGPNNLYFVSDPFRPTDLRVAMGGHDVYALKKPTSFTCEFFRSAGCSYLVEDT